MKKILILFIMILFLLVACSSDNTEVDISTMSFDEIVKLSKGTTVSFYGWGGDENINKWLDNTIAKELKETYDITLERVPMVPPEYIPKLLNEKQLSSEGTIDVVWINGENFYNAKDKDLLYGPITKMLPNYSKYLDVDSPDNNYDFGNAIDGYEAPYGKAQMVYICDSDKIAEMPTSNEKLLKLAKANPGKFTYPDITDFNGSAFVRNIIYDIVGFEKVINLNADKEEVKKVIQPAMDYLKELKPYLWRNGETYPATVAQLDNMYADGELYMTMNYTPFHVANKVNEGAFPISSQSFVFDKGSIGNTHFLAIPFNSPNKAAAIVLINHILSPEVQASKFDPKVWGDLPVIDPIKLSQSQIDIFENIDLGVGVLPQEELLTKRVPEMKALLVPIIEEIWREEILNE